ncbi:hypothetical protein [Streptococcus thermophilus]|uniref:hypothetical protein n=1 Tax=Streptococcus thermophilus TaxID=1308 RepID=UPI003D2F45FA
MSTENCDNKSFGTIRNNTALKLYNCSSILWDSFGTIRNNTALKLQVVVDSVTHRFGTIRNNTALKLCSLRAISRLRFWNHSKQHSELK